MKEKRKGRLDKGSGGGNKPTEFIGFSAFADTTSASASSTPRTPSSSTFDHVSANVRPTVKWSPVYTGSNEALHHSFTRISQKRDGITKTKALQELAALFSAATAGGGGGGVGGDSSTDDVSSSTISKWEVRVQALPHWMWLYANRLACDLTSMCSVRATSLQVWQEALRKVPKAVVAMATDELWGMWYAAQADPFRDVRNEAHTTVELANQVWIEHAQPPPGSFGGKADAPPWQKGLLAYSSRILGYGRPSVMHEALFAKKKSGFGGSSSEGTSVNEEKEEAEERFNLLTGLVLDAVYLLFQKMGFTVTAPDGNGDSDEPRSVLFRCMTSSVEGLRHRTYRLVAIVASSQKGAEQLLHISAINALMQSLSSEKNPNAWPTLLEAFLAVAVLADKNGDELPTTGWRKGLIKALRKACYGASLASWGPILLPLTSTLSATNTCTSQKDADERNALAPELIMAAWEGQHVTLGMTEAGRLAMAVAETAHFCLLRPIPRNFSPSGNNTATSDSEDGKAVTRAHALAIAEIWLEVLENALTDQSLATGNARTAAWEPLLRNLAQHLKRYQDHQSAVTNGNDTGSVVSAFGLIRDDFWSNVSWPCTHPEALAYFVSHLSSPSTADNVDQDQISRVAQTCFQELLAPYQESTAVLPSRAMYQAMQALVDYQPALVVTERFVMNDLLQWTVLHTTSQAPDYSDNNDDDLVRADFQLLASSLTGKGDASTYWPAVLRELILAKPSLHCLTLGIDVLLDWNASKLISDWIQCSVLDEFAINIFAKSSYFSAQEQLEFCRAVLGLTSRDDENPRAPIVSESVWESWIMTYKNSNRAASPKALAQILLEMTQVPQAASLLDLSSIESIILQSWLQDKASNDDASQEGSLNSNHHYMEILQSNREMTTRVVAKAGAEMKREVEEERIGTQDDNYGADWGLRALRLVEMCQRCPDQPSFSLLGLNNIDAWSDRPLNMYCLVMALFANMESKDCRFQLLQNTDNSTDLLLCILLNLCEASSDLTIAARVSNGDDNSSTFLRELGASSQEDYLNSSIQALVPMIVSNLENVSLSSPETSKTQRLAAVLSNLLRFAFPIELPTPQEPLPIPSEIRAGDQMWYVTDPKSPNQLEAATIAKVHYDAEAGYYFTIRIARDGEKAERQTIVDRLRQTKNPRASESSIPPIQAETASRIRQLIVAKILLPHFSSTCAECGLGDILNTMISRIGVGEGRGIGSSHFDLFRLLSDEEEKLSSALVNKNFQKAQEVLWKLALSFGFGLNSEVRDGTFRIFAFDPSRSFGLIVSLYSHEIKVGENGALDRAVLAWLSVSVPSVRVDEENADSVQRITGLAFSLTLDVLIAAKSSGLTSDTMLSMKAFAAMRRSLANSTSHVDNNADLRKEEADCFAIIIESFASNWEETKALDEIASPVWKIYSAFPRLIEDACQTESGRALLAEAITPSVAERLVHSLFSDTARFYAFNLLDCVLGKGKTLRSEKEIVLQESTTVHLKMWTENMDREGALELEEDVEVVSQWLPLSMMSEIETWQDETFEDLNETKTIGRLLAWLSILRLIETSVAAYDFRSRPAFVSYLTRAEVVPSVLNVSILFDETMNSPKSPVTPHVFDTDRILENEDRIRLSNLASHVIFRTFETLPSLCRRWWEEDCPKVYTSRVRSLVERQIAPEILQREMRRLKEATRNFGEMNVSGSLMSREVTATYMQDDFTLTVLIRLPASFPLRSAEVDCSRTLGVPLNRWKRWSLQITLMLNNQGGTLQDALMLWKGNVDKEFDGVEPCPICYSVLHVKTHKLPSLECSTCQNRFHADCLTEWFKQSGKSQCVLCQQDWRGVRVQ